MARISFRLTFAAFTWAGTYVHVHIHIEAKIFLGYTKNKFVSFYFTLEFPFGTHAVARF